MSHNTPANKIPRPPMSRNMAITPSPHYVVSAGARPAAATVSALSPGAFGTFLGDTPQRSSKMRSSSPLPAPRASSDTSATRLSSGSGQNCVFTMEIDGSLFGPDEDEDPTALAEEVSKVILQANRLAKPMDPFSVSLEEAVSEVLKRTPAVDLSEASRQLAAHGFSAVPRCTDGGIDSRLRHDFLEISPVAGSPVNSGSSYIVDPNYKELFQVAAVAEHRLYNRLLQAIPSTFVGTLAQMKELILFLCEHLGRSFKDLGVSMPPWRGPGSYLSLWIDAAKDNSFRAVPMPAEGPGAST